MEQELDIKDLLLALWRKKLIILVVTIISFCVGFLLYGRNSNSSSNKKIEDINYSETNFIFSGKDRTVIANNSTTIETNEKLVVNDELLTSLKKIATSRDFLKDAVNNIGVSEKVDIEDLQENIKIISNSDVITLIVGSKNKDIALNLPEKILNEIENKSKIIYSIKNLIVVDEPEIVENEKVEKLENEIAESKNTTNTNNSKEESGPSMKKVILITIVGFVGICGIIVVMELFDSSIKNEEFLEEITKCKNLGIINNLNQDESFKLLRVNLNECKTILVTSPEKYDGKSFVALNLAKAYEKLGKKVVLIDLVNNSSELVKKHDGKGLSDYLKSGDNSTSNYVAKTTLKNLDILLAGKEINDLPELLETYKMKDTLKLLENLYDVVIIDSESVLESASSLTMSKISKYTMLVVLERKTKSENILKAKNNIEDVGGTVVGTVYNKK